MKRLIFIGCTLLWCATAAAKPQRAAETEDLQKQVLELKKRVDDLAATVSQLKSPDQPAPVVAPADTVEAPTTPPPPPRPPPARARITGSVKIAGQRGKPNATVYVENVPARLARGKALEIIQIGKDFSPHFAVVQKGTRITFPNQDAIFHNVFSMSPGNSFDLGAYRHGDDAKGHTFVHPGLVEIFCNMHPQMRASVLVVPNALYAQAGEDGSFTLAGVPPGRRKIVAWAPEAEPTEQWIDVAPGAVIRVELTLESKKSAPHLNKYGMPYGSYQ